MYLRFFAQCLLRVGSADASRQIHTVLGLHVFHPLAHGFHHSRTVRTRGVGQRRLAGVSAGADVSVHRVHPCRLHSHHHLARVRLRVRNLLQLHHLRTAELVYPNRFHLSSSLPTAFTSDMLARAPNSVILGPDFWDLDETNAASWRSACC